MDTGNDISRRTVLLLLILTLIVSVIGTWAILSQPTSIYRASGPDRTDTGQVSLNIGEQEVVPPAISPETGKVSLNIVKP